MCLTKVKKACNTISKVSVLRCFLYKTHYKEDFWEWTPQMSSARAAISPRSSCSLIGLLCYSIGLFWDFWEWTPQMSGARAATSPGSLLLPNRALLLLIGLFWDFSEWTPQMSGPRAAISPTGLLWSRAWWGWGRCWREWALARPRPSWGWVPIRRCNTLSRPVIVLFVPGENKSAVARRIGPLGFYSMGDDGDNMRCVLFYYFFMICISNNGSARSRKSTFLVLILYCFYRQQHTCDMTTFT